MANLSIKYVVDSIEGNALSTTLDSENSGWVEYCNQNGTLFWGTVTQDWLQSNKNTEEKENVNVYNVYLFLEVDSGRIVREAFK